MRGTEMVSAFYAHGSHKVEDGRPGAGQIGGENAPDLILPEIPSMDDQIRAIEERQAALYAWVISIPSEAVDEILRTGGNKTHSQLRLIHNFMSEQTDEEYTEFVRTEYGTGGKGFEIDGTEYSVWFDPSGMQIVAGHSVHDEALDKTFLSWQDVSNRIHQLLKQGEYAPQAVLDSARDTVIREHAQSLAYFKMEMASGVAEHVFADMEPFTGVFPEVEKKEEETGKAKITPAFNLPCDYVLHTVGPIIRSWLTRKDKELLASCYRSCLELADQNNIKSVAFCCISTGEFHFPNDKAAQVAVSTVKDYKEQSNSRIEVIFNVFKDIDLQIYQNLLL